MITIDVDSDEEEVAVRDALAEAGLSFTIRRGRVYQGGGGSGAWTPAVTAGGGCIGFGGGASADHPTVTINAGGTGPSGGSAAGFGGSNSAACAHCGATGNGGHAGGCPNGSGGIDGEPGGPGVSRWP